MSGTQAAANALTNLARAAVGIGFAGSALSALMYNGTWHPEKGKGMDGEKNLISALGRAKKKMRQEEGVTRRVNDLSAVCRCALFDGSRHDLTFSSPFLPSVILPFSTPPPRCIHPNA